MADSLDRLRATDRVRLGDHVVIERTARRLSKCLDAGYLRVQVLWM